MPKLRKFFEALTEDLFNFNLLLIPFALLAAIIAADIKEPLFMLFFALLLPYFYFLRLKVKKLSLFLLFTWSVCLIGLLTEHKVLYTIFIGFMCSHNVRLRTSEEAKLNISFEVLCFPLAFLAAIYIAAPYIHLMFIRPFIYGQAAAMLVLAMLYVHLNGINAELELASASALQPTAAVTGFANKVLAIYVFGFIALLLLFRFVPFGSLALIVGRFIVKVLRLLFSRIDNNADAITGAPMAGIKQTSPDIAIEELPIWLQIIEKILIYTVNIAVLLVIIGFILWFFLKLYRGFYSKRKTKLVYNDEISQIKALKKPKKTGIFYNHKIENALRRKYYRLVKPYFKKHRFSASDTPEEIKNKLEDKVQLKELTPLYEKERYDKH